MKSNCNCAVSESVRALASARNTMIETMLVIQSPLLPNVSTPQNYYKVAFVLVPSLLEKILL